MYSLTMSRKHQPQAAVREENKVSILKKLKNHQGMTLAEVLIAVIIMIIATALMAACIRLGVTMFQKQKRVSQAQMLLDSLTVSIQDELRFATGISGGTPFTYSSRNRAGQKDCSIVNSTAKAGHIVIKTSGTSATEIELAPDSAYDKLNSKLNSASWDGSVFTIDLIIYYDDESKPITEKTFTVAPLSPDYNVEFE